MGFVLLLLATTTALIKAQGRSPLLDRVVRSIKREEPRWRFIPGVCTCPPLVSGQRSYAAGGWYLEEAGERRHVSIYVSYVPSAQLAAEWMESMSRWPVAEGWRGEKYSLGDEAYLSRNQDGTNSTVSFRKGKIVVEVSGELGDVVRFAGYAEKEVPAAI